MAYWANEQVLKKINRAVNCAKKKILGTTNIKATKLKQMRDEPFRSFRRSSPPFSIDTEFTGVASVLRAHKTTEKLFQWGCNGGESKWSDMESLFFFYLTVCLCRFLFIRIVALLLFRIHSITATATITKKFDRIESNIPTRTHKNRCFHYLFLHYKVIILNAVKVKVKRCVGR